MRRLTALAAALALAACGTEAPNDSARDWPEPSPALWELSGRHGEKAWLFGTIHALPDGAEWRTPAFERAFAASDLVMVEIGDLAELQEEMEGAFLRQPALRETLLVERNEYFAARIAETVEERHRPFVAVGAGHMLGPDGLPALLAARGYTVRRVQ